MIEFIYFDIGGVLIDDFYNGKGKWEAMLSSIGVTNENMSVFNELWAEFSPHLNIDRDVDDMAPALRQAGIAVPDDFSLLFNGFVHHFHANKPIWPIIARLNHARCGILSNMYPRMYDAIVKKGILPPGTETWVHTIESSTVGMQKPNVDIYEHAAARTGLAPHQLLFVDNLEENLVPAQSLGWQTFHWDSYNHEQSAAVFTRFLQENGVLGG